MNIIEMKDNKINRLTSLIGRMFSVKKGSMFGERKSRYIFRFSRSR